VHPVQALIILEHGVQWNYSDKNTSFEGDSNANGKVRNSIINPKEDKRPKANSDSEVIRCCQYMKLPQFGGNSSLESFLAQFYNCATFNKWDEEEQLAFLCGS